MIAVIIEANNKRRQEELHDAALIGWQVVANMPRDKKHKVPSFKEWLRKLGIKEHYGPPTETDIERDIEKARQLEQELGGMRFG